MQQNNLLVSEKSSPTTFPAQIRTSNEGALYPQWNEKWQQLNGQACFFPLVILWPQWKNAPNFAGYVFQVFVCAQWRKISQFLGLFIPLPEFFQFFGGPNEKFPQTSWGYSYIPLPKMGPYHGFINGGGDPNDK